MWEEQRDKVSQYNMEDIFFEEKIVDEEKLNPLANQ